VFNSILIWFSGALLLTVMVGFIRIEMGPTRADRMLSAQLFGTSAVAILLILSVALDMQSLVDVALGIGLLAAIAATAFVKRAWRDDEDPIPDNGTLPGDRSDYDLNRDNVNHREGE